MNIKAVSKSFAVVFITIALFMGLTLSGCSSNNSSSTSSSSSSSSDKITKVTLVTSGDGEPYTLLSDNGKTWTGIDAEMWDEIKARTGWEVEVKQASFESMWGELDTQRADVVANCTAVKEERTQKYLASIPYYGDAQCVVVNESSSYKTLDDLKGKTIGCKSGQAAQTIIEGLASEKGFTVKLYEDSAVGMSDLALDRIDAFANTTTNVNNYLHNNSNAHFRFFEENLKANNVAYFLPKTDRGEKIKSELDKVLKEMIDDGTVGKITEKWMYADMTKLIQSTN